MTRLNHLALNQCHLNFSTDGAVGIPKKKGGEIPSAIRDSMVLWYDLKKQGATNEAMAADPRIIDHSGNGHHATCYNFAWTEESGINTTNYPNALVSDGVDDYAMVKGIPILTKKRGYTVVVKREIINKTGCVCSNRITNGISGAFSFELLPLGVTDSFGSRTIITEQDIPNIFSYQKSQLYNYLSLNTSTTVNEGVENLILFELNPTNIGPYAANIALYSLLLFDRDLTTEEIEWVKNNLITE